jgi:antitoxin VapB
LRKGGTAQTISLQTKHSIPGTIVAGRAGWKTFRPYGNISVVALNIKDKETEALVNEIASLTGVTTTEAVRQSAQERLERLQRERGKTGSRLDYDPLRDAESFERWLETRIRPLLKEENRGKPITKAEREELLGYGPGGV